MGVVFAPGFDVDLPRSGDDNNAILIPHSFSASDGGWTSGPRVLRLLPRSFEFQLFRLEQDGAIGPFRVEDMARVSSQPEMQEEKCVE